jgi:hypothetical protein
MDTESCIVCIYIYCRMYVCIEENSKTETDRNRMVGGGGGV